MPRTQRQPAPTTSANVITSAKNEFLRLHPVIDEIKKKLKQKKKEQKDITNKIYEHMDEQGLDEFEVGQFIFKKQEVERCPFNEKNFKTMVEGSEAGEDLLQQYKERFTESKTTYKMNKGARV